MTHLRVSLLLVVILQCMFLQTALGRGNRIKSCSPSPCQNERQCKVDTRTRIPYCVCGTGYIGVYCEFENPCDGATGTTRRCFNGGTCDPSSSAVELYVCRCRNGYRGLRCEVKPPNLNCFGQHKCDQGSCVLVDMSFPGSEYQCECKEGFTGRTCSKVDQCATSPCQHDTTCTLGEDSSSASPSDSVPYRCDCFGSGYRGHNCHVDVNECSAEDRTHRCLNGASCVNTPGSYTCDCATGYEGDRCELVFEPCRPGRCKNGGYCSTSGITEYTCTCSTGFEGTNCEINIDECKTRNTCKNGATCIDGINSIRCECATGWKGIHCTADVNECLRTPCRNGAECHNTKGAFSCNCSQGYTGALCDVSLDDCSPNPCHNGGTCVDRHLGFQCLCSNNYQGATCNILNPCVSNPCKNGVKCTDSAFNNTYSCDCKDTGFTGEFCELDIDECETKPCGIGSQCLNDYGTYKCSCSEGFTGSRCDTQLMACISNPCQNHATCMDQSTYYKCICYRGFTGKQCENRIDVCASVTCENGGRCHNYNTTFTCTCQPGYIGGTCSIDVDDCELQPCGTHGTCTDLINSFRCNCHSGYTGATCQQEIDACQSSPCHAQHGSCTSTKGVFRCACTPGYQGDTCTTRSQPCLSNPCLYQGTCEEAPLADSYRCHCLPGTSGDNCEMNTDDCLPNPCHNEAVCSDGINAYTCECEPGYTGDDCDVDVDECLSSPCYGGATCVNRANSYSCSCGPGYYGQHCRSETDACTSTPCRNGGSCRDDHSDRPSCACLPGYSGNICEIDVDECSSTPCQHDAKCSNLIGRYECTCKAGYTGLLRSDTIGKNCEQNIDDCLSSPCEPHGTCIDQVAGYKCTCSRGWTGVVCGVELTPCHPQPCYHNARCVASYDFTSFTCECDGSGFTGDLCNQDIDECTVADRCSGQGRCVNTPGSYRCDCYHGYRGKQCQLNPDECASDPCHNGATCLDGLGQYTCLCVDGFQGGQCATETDECASSPCVNGAVCHDYVNAYVCACVSGYSGRNCQRNDDDCTDSSCLNGGGCVDKVNSYVCECVNHHRGANCEIAPSLCDSSPCLNGAECLTIVDSATSAESIRCQCPRGYAQPYCNTVVNYCAATPCKNGATCAPTGQYYECHCADHWSGRHCDMRQVACKDVKVADHCQNGGRCRDIYASRGSKPSHRCECKPGYEGSHCDLVKDVCKGASPCRNGATCRSAAAGRYECDCVLGYQGATCEFDIDECHDDPCLNGGRCHDLVAGFSCSCPPGTSGQRCQYNEDDCLSDACYNGGTCVDEIGRYSCVCPPGFAGNRCEADVNECASNPCSPVGGDRCQQLVNDYRCTCKQGWTGRNCEVVITGHCTQLGRAPANNARECLNGGICLQSTDGPTCECLEGYTGDKCENPMLLTTTVLQPSTGQTTCPHTECSTNSNNDICDKQCNNRECDFDGGDCTYGVVPYAECHHQGGGVQCSQTFNDSHCDAQCNTQACLFDGMDCIKKDGPTTNHCHANNCTTKISNGVCDKECLTCYKDGGDCDAPDAARLPSDGSKVQTLVLVLLVNRQTFLDEVRQRLLSGLTLLLKSKGLKYDFCVRNMYSYRLPVVIMKDESGIEMIYDWPNNRRSKRSTGQVKGVQVYMSIDTTNCKGHCFTDTKYAAEFIAWSLTIGRLFSNIPILSIQSKVTSSPSTDKGTSPLNVILAASVSVVIVALLMGVLFVQRNRKRVTGKTWFPEGFLSKVMPQRTQSQRNQGYSEQSTSSSNEGTWDTSDSASSSPEKKLPAKRRKLCPERGEEAGSTSSTAVVPQGGPGEEPPYCETDDSRAWTPSHLQALASSPVLQQYPSSNQIAALGHMSTCVLTPPHQDCMRREIDVTGPDGLTPLMIASYCRNSNHQGDPTSIICDLIHQGADIHAQTDTTGETALHLAARHCRLDSVVALLDAGADPNATDKTGRTVLHTAIASDAIDIFRMLIRKTQIHVNARQADGATALILIARLSIEGATAALLQYEVDINMTDNYGKSALHWAAAVDNLSVLKDLLVAGANKDAQDLQDETPLYQACREGNAQAVLLLLEHGASRSIAASECEVTPRDIADERGHQEVVNLLDTHRPSTRDPPGDYPSSAHVTTLQATGFNQRGSKGANTAASSKRRRAKAAATTARSNSIRMQAAKTVSTPPSGGNSCGQYADTRLPTYDNLCPAHLMGLPQYRTQPAPPSSQHHPPPPPQQMHMQHMQQQPYYRNPPYTMSPISAPVTAAPHWTIDAQPQHGYAHYPVAAAASYQIGITPSVKPDLDRPLANNRYPTPPSEQMTAIILANDLAAAAAAGAGTVGVTALSDHLLLTPSPETSASDRWSPEGQWSSDTGVNSPPIVPPHHHQHHPQWANSSSTTHLPTPTTAGSLHQLKPASAHLVAAMERRHAVEPVYL